MFRAQWAAYPENYLLSPEQLDNKADLKMNIRLVYENVLSFNKDIALMERLDSEASNATNLKRTSDGSSSASKR